MDYAAVLYFDKESEDRILDMRGYLINNKENMYDAELRPHITLAAWTTEDYVNIDSKLKEFIKRYKAFNVVFPSIGIFTTKSNVLFLNPVKTEYLISMHKDFYQSFNEFNYNQLYTPINWVPHCTLGNRLSKDELTASIANLIDYKLPISAIASEIALIECNSLQDIFSCSITRQQI